MTHPQIWLATGLGASVAGVVLLSGSWLPLVVAGLVVALVGAVYVDW